jgi:hypothetical protein
MSQSFDPQPWSIDYDRIAKLAPSPEMPSITAFLAEELPYDWRDAYLDHTARAAHILRVLDEGFTYLFDYYSTLGETGTGMVEDRLVCAFGTSRQASTKRNTNRQRGWVGPTEKTFGAHRDKGHYIPHSLGGGLEINLFVQSRELNRGWSLPGGVYRSMERYGLDHPGTFLFNRPLYADGTAVPAMLEFGLLKADGQLWVERFAN